MDRHFDGAILGKVHDENCSTDEQRIAESIRECEKLRLDNDSLRQNYLNVQASLKNLQDRYRETKEALIRQLDINRAFQEMEKCLSHAEASTNKHHTTDVLSAVDDAIGEIPFDKKNNQGIKICNLQKEVRFRHEVVVLSYHSKYISPHSNCCSKVELWQNKYYEVKRDHDIVQSKYEFFSSITMKKMESIEEAKNADILSFREKVVNLIQSRFRDRSSKSQSWSELQEAKLALQKLIIIEAQLRADLLDAVNKRKEEENRRIDLKTQYNVELAVR